MTREEIRSQISILNNKIMDLSLKNNNYNTALSSINCLIANLNAVKNELGKATFELTTSYCKDGKVAKSKEFSDCNEDISNIINQLNNIVIPAINNSRNIISRDIEKKSDKVNKLRDELNNCTE